MVRYRGRDQTRGGRVRMLAFVLAVAASAVACGRKGPPLPPLVQVPAPVEDLAVRRVGDQVYITFTVPARNVDASVPAAISRVDVLAVTASTPPARDVFLRDGSPVASVSVAPAQQADGRPEAEQPEGLAVPPGTRVTVLDALQPSQAESDDDDSAPLFRYYLAVSMSERGQSSASGRLTSVPADAAPAPPAALSATHTEDAIQLTWMPAEEDVRYQVYGDTRALEAGSPGAVVAGPPVPLHEPPLEAPSYSEAIAGFGQERCYRVTTLRLAEGAAPVESAPSPPACITPVDRFPPAAPSGLVAVAGPDGIALSWSPNREPDLAGYLILRGTPADVRLLPVTGTPITDTQYLDRDVVPGMRYVYAVVAVDARTPPNLSEESARDAVTAR